MAGILDTYLNPQPAYGGILGEAEMKSAQQKGLLGGLAYVAQALSQAGQPTRFPGGGIGSALGAFPIGQAQAQNDAMNQAVRSNMAGLQFDKANMEIQQAKDTAARQKAWTNLVSGGGGFPQSNGEVAQPAGMTPMQPAGASPSGFGSVFAKLPPETRAALANMPADQGMKYLADLGVKQMETDEWQDAEQDGIKGQRNRRTGKFEPFPASALTDQYVEFTGPNGQLMQRNVRTNKLEPIDPTPRNTTNVNLPAIKQRTEVEEFMGKKYADMLNGEFTAPARLGKLDRLDSLLGQTYTGAGGEQSLQVKKALKSAGDSIGVDTSSLDGAIGAGEAARALGNEMALQLRNTGQGGGMPGSLSNSDRDFLVDQIPNLSTTPEGRRLIVATHRAIIQRDIEVSKQARAYAAKNGGRIDENFFGQLSAWSEANPLFPRPKSEQDIGGLKRGSVFIDPKGTPRIKP